MQLLVALLALVALNLLYLLSRAQLRLIQCHQRETPGWSGVILIFVPAQDPLVDGMRAGPIFQARLDKASELYRDYESSEEKMWQTKIVVCGSQHHNDKISLCQAATDYLRLKQGIAKGNIISRIDSCYNCMDEIRIFVNVWRQFTQLPDILPKMIMICPEHKALRNQVAFAWRAKQLPEFVYLDEKPTQEEKRAERWLEKYTLLFDPDWQGRLSPMHLATWSSRRA